MSAVQEAPHATIPVIASVMAWLDARLPRALAISLGLGDVPDAGAIRAAQINGVVALTPLAMLASILNSAVLLLFLARQGLLDGAMILWALCILGLAARYVTRWRRGRARGGMGVASARALRRAVLHGGLFGALWGVVPVLAFPMAPGSVQVVVGCLTAGMLCAGGFVLATVPLAACAYVTMVLSGATWAILREGLSPETIGLTALLCIYAAVVVTNLVWNAALFVEHLLTERQLVAEVRARELAQARAEEAQRLAALGEVAGGIAHDVNNVMQAIAARAVLIGRRAADDLHLAALAKAVEAAAVHGGEIVGRLRALGLLDTLLAEPVAIGKLLAEADARLRDLLGPKITLRISCERALPLASVDRSQLMMVLFDLAANARDAMAGGGTLAVTAVGETVEGQGEPPLPPGRYVRLGFADTGLGMAPEVLQRATEPFFTTKAKDRGNGLGLAIARGFADRSGGALSIRSEPGAGTSVALWLPAIDAQAPAARERAAIAGAGCRVLFVDDDEDLRDSLASALGDAGFLLRTAADAVGALAWLDGEEACHILVSDFAMPGLNGIELIRAARVRRPGLPAILLTGNVADAIHHRDGETDPAAFVLVQKPVRTAELVARMLPLISGDVGSGAVGPLAALGDGVRPACLLQAPRLGGTEAIGSSFR